jgi:hypothetical protein
MPDGRVLVEDASDTPRAAWWASAPGTTDAEEAERTRPTRVASAAATARRAADDLAHDAAADDRTVCAGEVRRPRKCVVHLGTSRI